MLCKGSDRRRRTTNHQAVCSRNLSKIRKLLKTAGARELEACSARDDTSASKQSKASNKALHWAVTLVSLSWDSYVVAAVLPVLIKHLQFSRGHGNPHCST